MDETNENNEHSYDVIQFLELPYESIDKYIIIPHSWIRIKLVSEGAVIVAYPIEDERKTYKRVENNTNFKKQWKRYTAVVKYEARSFEEARCWISVATLGNFNMYQNVIETKMDLDDNSIEDDYNDEDCIILIKEEPVDIYDNFVDVVTQINVGHVDSGTTSMNDEEQIDLNEGLSGADNLITPFTYNPKDIVTTPTIEDEKINHNECCDGANNFVPKTNTDKADTTFAHTKENHKDDGVAPFNMNDRNKQGATIKNNSCTDNFVNDAVEYISPAHGNGANDCVAPINNTDIGNHAAVNSNIEDYVSPKHNNEAFDYIGLEPNNNTNDGAPSEHNLNENKNNYVAPINNNCTDSRAALNDCNYRSDYVNGAEDHVTPTKNNKADEQQCAATNDGSENNYIIPISNDENTDKIKSPQNMLNAVATTSNTKNLIQTGRPRSVIIFEPSKSTRKKTCATIFCNSPPPNTITKPQMTVMPLINTHNDLAPSKSVKKCTKKRQLTKNEKEKSNRDTLIKHSIKFNLNLKAKDTYPILQDNILQPLTLEKNGTPSVNNVFHQQAYSQGFSNSANMSFNPSENRNLSQKQTSRVSVNYWTQDQNNPSFDSPSVESTSTMTHFNSIQDNMISANENRLRIQPEPSCHDYNKQPVTVLENCLRAESVRPNLPHNTVTQMNYIDQTAYSQNAANTASTQHFTKCTTYSNSNSGQGMTSANENFALAKCKFSLASVQNAELSCHDYNVPVILHENYSSIESISAKIIDHRVNPKKRMNEKVYSSNVKNTATTEYLTHRNFNPGQQVTPSNVIMRTANVLSEHSTRSNVHPTPTHEPPQSNNLLSTHRKKTQRNSSKQLQQNSSNYTFSVQPGQIIISDSTDQVPQNIANNQSSPLQNSFSAAPQHWNPHAFPRHNMPYDPQATQISVRKPMESNSMYFQYGVKHGMMGPPSVLQNPGHLNANKQVSQFTRPLNSNLLAHDTSTIFPNSSQTPHYQGYSQGIPTAISNTPDSICQGPHFEGYVNTGSPGVLKFANQVVPFSDHTSIHRAHVVPDTNGLFFRKLPSAYPFDQRTSIHSTSMNLPLGFQQYPAANQLKQHRGRFNEQQTAPIYENNPMHETHMQNTNTKQPAAVHTRSFNPQPYHQHLQYSQNIESLEHNPTIQRNQYHCPNKCCNPNVVMSAVLQNYPYQKQNQNTEFSVGNALNSTNLSSEYLDKKQLATQQQNSSSRKQHNCTEPSGCQTNHKENEPNSPVMHQTLTNQAEAYNKKNTITPMHENSSDDISTEFITIEQSNYTKECVTENSKNRHSYENSDRLSSISLNSSDEEISIKENTFEKTNKARNKVQSIRPQNVKNCLPDNCVQHSSVLDRRTSLKEIKTHLKKMKSRSSKTYSTLQTRFDSYTGHIDIWKNLKEIINVYIDHKIKESSSQVKLQFQNQNKGKNNARNLCLYNDQSSGDDSDDDSDDCREPPKKKAVLQNNSP